MAADDPADWAVDRLVQELCDKESKWIRKGHREWWPEPAYVEKFFRAEDIDGIAFMTFDDHTLKLVFEKRYPEVFATKPFLAIAHVLKSLRDASPKYWASLMPDIAEAAAPLSAEASSADSARSLPQDESPSATTKDKDVDISAAAISNGLNSPHMANDNHEESLANPTITNSTDPSTESNSRASDEDRDAPKLNGVLEKSELAEDETGVSPKNADSAELSAREATNSNLVEVVADLLPHGNAAVPSVPADDQPVSEDLAAPWSSDLLQNDTVDQNERSHSPTDSDVLDFLLIRLDNEKVPQGLLLEAGLHEHSSASGAQGSSDGNAASQPNEDSQQSAPMDMDTDEGSERTASVALDALQTSNDNVQEILASLPPLIPDSKPKRRIAPDLVTTKLEDLDRTLPTLADNLGFSGASGIPLDPNETFEFDDDGSDIEAVLSGSDYTTDFGAESESDDDVVRPSIEPTNGDETTVNGKRRIALVEIEVDLDAAPRDAMDSSSEAEKGSNDDDIPVVTIVNDKRRVAPIELEVDPDAALREAMSSGSEVGKGPDENKDPMDVDEEHHSQLDKEVSDAVPSFKERIAAAKALRKQEQQHKDMTSGYLGKTKMPVNGIFFSGEPIGSQLAENPDEDESDTFFTMGKKVSTGRQLYIARQMKHFLLAPTRLVQRGGKTGLALEPYALNLSQEGESFYLATKSSDGSCTVTREDAAQYRPARSVSKDVVEVAEIDKDSARPRHGDIVNLLKRPSTYDQLDLDELEARYKNLDSDELLPVFGDSDFEGYDSDIVREIDQEDGVVTTPRRSSKQPFSRVEIGLIIDRYDRDLKKNWKTKELPKLEAKAWKYWNKYKQNKSFERRKQKDIYNDLVRRRIPALRNEIICVPDLKSEEEVVKLCGSMDNTLRQREEAKWRIRCLDKEEAPEKPMLEPKNAQAKPQPRQRREQASGGGADSESENSMDGFIIPDAESDNDDDMLNLPALNRGDRMSSARDGYEGEVLHFSDADDGKEIIVKSTEKVKPEDEAYSPRTPTKQSVKKSPRKSGSRQAGVIDLTGSSPPTREYVDLLIPNDKSKQPSREPAFSPRYRGRRNLILDDSDSDPAMAHSNANARGKSFDGSGYESGSDDLSSSDEEGTDLRPSLNDPIASAMFGNEWWEDHNDPSRLVACVVEYMPKEDPKKTWRLLVQNNNSDLFDKMKKVMRAQLDEHRNVKGIPKNDIVAYELLWRLFHMFIECKQFDPDLPVSEDIFQKVRTSGSRFKCYTKDLQKILDYYFDKDAVRLKDPAKNLSSAKQIYATNDKLKEQIKRREQLRTRLAASDVLSDDRAKVLINESKKDDEGFIFVHEFIASRIKEHQIDGVRFMWSQIVQRLTKNEKATGCLLAHTMGLGKTMQVITLLTAIAEAAHSEDESVSNQVPYELKKNRVLVLAPPGLLDNWYDELLIWVPDAVFPLMGAIRKVTSADKTQERYSEIDAWAKGGGILLLGYEMYRSVIFGNREDDKPEDKPEPTDDSAPNKSSRDPTPMETYDEKARKTAAKQLTTKTSFVIADEAHKFKTASSLLNKAMSQFKTRSRLALTGSPLSNNLMEYYQIIEWVSPGYLGDRKEFVGKFETPIKEGLYVDSTRGQHRQAHRLLLSLKKLIQPKVHRCDSDVLKNDLPPKTEFFMFVPLTEFQRKVYDLYVSINDKTSSDEHHTKDGNLKEAYLWAWINNLRLICYHPALLKQDLAGEKAIAVRKLAEDADALREAKYSLPEATRKEICAGIDDLMKDYHNAMDPIHSTKLTLLNKILDESKRVGDKVLIFTGSIRSIDALQEMFERDRRKFCRLTGATKIGHRQGMIKKFNTSNDFDIFIISTRAGGIGLNLHGANRVIVMDFNWNPSDEEQAIGRAYRLGQKKHVYVYRFVSSGTFEETMYNGVVFKIQLLDTAVDSRNVKPVAQRDKSVYLAKYRDQAAKDLKLQHGKDPEIMDKILATQDRDCTIKELLSTDIFRLRNEFEPDNEDKAFAEKDALDFQLKQSDPVAYQRKMDRERQENYQKMVDDAQRKQQASGTSNKPAVASKRQVVSNPVPAILLPPRKVWTAKTTSSSQPAPAPSVLPTTGLVSRHHFVNLSQGQGSGHQPKPPTMSQPVQYRNPMANSNALPSASQPVQGRMTSVPLLGRDREPIAPQAPMAPPAATNSPSRFGRIKNVVGSFFGIGKGGPDTPPQASGSNDHEQAPGNGDVSSDAMDTDDVSRKRKFPEDESLESDSSSSKRARQKHTEMFNALALGPDGLEAKFYPAVVATPQTATNIVAKVCMELSKFYPDRVDDLAAKQIALLERADWKDVKRQARHILRRDFVTFEREMIGLLFGEEYTERLVADGPLGVSAKTAVEDESSLLATSSPMPKEPLSRTDDLQLKFSATVNTPPKRPSATFVGEDKAAMEIWRRRNGYADDTTSESNVKSGAEGTGYLVDKDKSSALRQLEGRNSSPYTLNGTQLSGLASSSASTPNTRGSKKRSSMAPPSGPSPRHADLADMGSSQADAIDLDDGTAPPSSSAPAAARLPRTNSGSNADLTAEVAAHASSLPPPPAPSSTAPPSVTGSRLSRSPTKTLKVEPRSRLGTRAPGQSRNFTPSDVMGSPEQSKKEKRESGWNLKRGERATDPDYRPENGSGSSVASSFNGSGTPSGRPQREQPQRDSRRRSARFDCDGAASGYDSTAPGSRRSSAVSSVNGNGIPSSSAPNAVGPRGVKRKSELPQWAVRDLRGKSGSRGAGMGRSPSVGGRMSATPKPSGNGGGSRPSSSAQH